MLRKPSHDDIMDVVHRIITTAGDSSAQDIASYIASAILDLMTSPKKTMIKLKA